MQNEDDSTDVDYIYVEILLSHFRCKVYYGNKYKFYLNMRLLNTMYEFIFSVSIIYNLYEAKTMFAWLEKKSQNHNLPLYHFKKHI